jgi:hypothetical protein
MAGNLFCMLINVWESSHGVKRQAFRPRGGPAIAALAKTRRLITGNWVSQHTQWDSI